MGKLGVLEPTTRRIAMSRPPHKRASYRSVSAAGWNRSASNSVPGPLFLLTEAYNA